MVERRVEHPPSAVAELREARRTRILLSMFDVVQGSTSQSDRECFNQLVSFWADCLRVDSMPEADHEMVDRLMPWTQSFIDECTDRKADFFGEVFLLRVCSGDDASLLLPSEASIRDANDVMISSLPNDLSKWGTVFDPSAGTGRFLIDLAVRYPQRRIALFGVEPDLDLYRACLLNMRLYAWNRPSFIVCADSEIVEVGPNSPSWLYANVWKPPNWALAEGGPLGRGAIYAG
jgi:hypothetical protein